MTATVPEMLKMSQAQLDDLFTQSPAGEIPKGEAKGTAIVAPGTTYTQDIANFTLFLGSDDSSAMSAQTYLVDGGWV